jgi:N-ethylmaleimide reductase
MFIGTQRAIGTSAPELIAGKVQAHHSTSRMMLSSEYQLGPITLSNRIVMAPMTRCRAIDNTPNALMAEYYAQRASAGLIITEGTAPSKHGLGYARIPGLFTLEQVRGWKLVTHAVHERGGRIFVQLMHTGRVAHLANMPEGAEVMAPSARACPGEIYTDTLGQQPHALPKVMTSADIRQAADEHATAAKYALEAGFDGVELHGGNGYLIEQFLNANINQRSDAYGGSRSARSRFAIEVALATIAAIGPERVGYRLSPHGTFNGTGDFPDAELQYLELVREFSAMRLAYLHLVDHLGNSPPGTPNPFVQSIRAAFSGALMLSSTYTREQAEAELASGHADLIALGRPFIANPDLVERFVSGAALNTADCSTFYSSGAEGYIDYPELTRTSTPAHEVF